MECYLEPLRRLQSRQSIWQLSATVRDLRVYADAMDGQVYHYRDKRGLECDAIIHLRNGSYGLVEIKL